MKLLRYTYSHPLESSDFIVADTIKLVVPFLVKVWGHKSAERNATQASGNKFLTVKPVYVSAGTRTG